MANKVGWGVVGACGIARRRTIPEGIVPATNAKLVGLCDRNSEGNAKLARTFGARAFESLEYLLAAEIDAVYIATPVFLHAAQVMADMVTGARPQTPQQKTALANDAPRP
jgi:predicted dehydrogenase